MFLLPLWLRVLFLFAALWLEKRLLWFYWFTNCCSITQNCKFGYKYLFSHKALYFLLTSNKLLTRGNYHYIVSIPPLLFCRKKDSFNVHHTDSGQMWLTCWEDAHLEKTQETKSATLTLFIVVANI